MRNILLIGSTGNLGSAVKRYLESKEYIVYCAVRKPIYEKEILVSAFEPILLPKGVTIDLIINASNKYYINPEFNQVIQMSETILGLSKSILQSNFTCPIVYFSSYLQFLPDEFQPWSIYTEMKSESSEIMLEYGSDRKSKVFEIVLYDNYGGKRKNKFFDLALSAAISQKLLPATKGESVLNLTHINDIVSNLEVFIREDSLYISSGYNHSYSIYSSDTFNLKELSKYIENILGVKVPIVWDAIPYRDKEVFKFYNSKPLLPNFIQNIHLKDYIASQVNKKS
jgi:nucleoside-diphosphate-sugar epimerase